MISKKLNKNLAIKFVLEKIIKNIFKIGEKSGKR